MGQPLCAYALAKAYLTDKRRLTKKGGLFPPSRERVVLYFILSPDNLAAAGGKCQFEPYLSHLDPSRRSFLTLPCSVDAEISVNKPSFDSV